MPEGRQLRGLPAREVLRALKKAGWDQSATSGKHYGVENPDKPGVRITVPIHGGREIPVKTVRSIAKAAGLTTEEFEELL